PTTRWTDGSRTSGGPGCRSRPATARPASVARLPRPWTVGTGPDALGRAADDVRAGLQNAALVADDSFRLGEPVTFVEPRGARRIVEVDRQFDLRDAAVGQRA